MWLQALGSNWQLTPVKIWLHLVSGNQGHSNSASDYIPKMDTLTLSERSERMARVRKHKEQEHGTSDGLHISVQRISPAWRRRVMWLASPILFSAKNGWRWFVDGFVFGMDVRVTWTNTQNGRVKFLDKETRTEHLNGIACDPHPAIKRLAGDSDMGMSVDKEPVECLTRIQRVYSYD